MRRSQAALEDAVERASSVHARAIALYRLALFHDNNSREAVAIPLYEKAIAFGLSPNLKAQALVWLSSSLYKTGNSKGALTRIDQARELATSREVREFLEGLEARINRRLRTR